MGFRWTAARLSCDDGTVRRKLGLSVLWFCVVGATVACGSRTGLQGFGDSAVGVGGVPGGGGWPGTGGFVGTGGLGGTGGVPGAGGTGGFPGSGGTPGVGGVPSSLDCPLSSDDPRLAGFAPGLPGQLELADFLVAPVVGSRWTVQLEDCDAILPQPSFTVSGTEGPTLFLTPGRPGPYHITLEVDTLEGRVEGCELTVPVLGRGIRVDLCWDTSTTVDIDLYVHTPLNENPYYVEGAELVPDFLTAFLTVDTCNPANCAPNSSFPRPVFDRPDSPLEFCSAGPSAAEYLALGQCPNPRSGRDNNQSEATGVSEVVQIDNPRPGDVMRVMVQNFDNDYAAPHVVVYCAAGDQRVALDLPGAPYNFITNLVPRPGVLWRAADIMAVQTESGVGCAVFPLEHPSFPGEPYLTTNQTHY